MNVELRDLTPDERKEVQQRFDMLASKRFAPTLKKPRHEVWWPKAPLDGRAFPEGIHPPEGDDSFNESTRLLGFLNGVCGGYPSTFASKNSQLRGPLAAWHSAAASTAAQPTAGNCTVPTFGGRSGTVVSPTSP